MNQKEVIFYTINCAKCKVLEMKLKQKNIDYKIVSDEEEVVSVGLANKITGAPFLSVDGEFYSYENAVRFINSLS